MRGPGSWARVEDYPDETYRRRYADPLADVTDLVTDLERVTP